MTLSEFNTLEPKQKSDLVWEWGHYLTSRKNETHNIVLFLISDFFAEAHITLFENKTTLINGMDKSELHPDFQNILNHEDPFVKAYIKPDSSSRHRAA